MNFAQNMLFLCVCVWILKEKRCVCLREDITLRLLENREKEIQKSLKREMTELAERSVCAEWERVCAELYRKKERENDISIMGLLYTMGVTTSKIWRI